MVHIPSLTTITKKNCVTCDYYWASGMQCCTLVSYRYKQVYMSVYTYNLYIAFCMFNWLPLKSQRDKFIQKP